jgi:hypothetical protein
MSSGLRGVGRCGPVDDKNLVAERTNYGARQVSQIRTCRTGLSAMLSEQTNMVVTVFSVVDGDM